MRRPSIVALLVFALSLLSRPSFADAVLVVLVRPSAECAIASEAITRIRGELVADGFEVSVVDAPPDPQHVSRGSAPEVLARRSVELRKTSPLPVVI